MKSKEKEKLANDKETWFRVLGKKYNNISKNEKKLDKLLNLFFCKYKRIIIRRYGSLDDFCRKVKSLSRKEAEKRIKTLWAINKWDNKNSSDYIFNTENGFEDILEEIEKDNIIYEKLGERLNVVWPGVSTLKPFKENKKIMRSRREVLYPILIKENKNKKLEIRGGKQKIKKFSNKYLKDIDSIEPKVVSKSILENLKSIFNDGLPSLRLIGIKFNESYLPTGASIVIENDEGILRDLMSKKIKDNIIDMKSLAELKYLQFFYSPTQSKIKIKVKTKKEGFKFSIQDSHTSEEDKKNIREIIYNELGIDFNEIYEYSEQHDANEIFHKILSGNCGLYKKFKDSLNGKINGKLSEFVELKKKKSFICFECEKKYNTKPKKCEDCENRNFSERIEEELNVNEKKIFNEVSKKISGLDEGKFISNSISLANINFKDIKKGSSNYIQSTFTLTNKSSDGRTEGERMNYFFFPIGNNRIPKKINQYLLNTVLVVYGNSYYKKRDFGNIDLYDLFTKSDKEIGKIIIKSVINSKKLLKDRIEKERRSFQRDLIQLSKIDLSENNKNFFKTNYSDTGKIFEKSIFYLLKFMFPYTERWGREGEAEADGVIKLREGENNYKVFSYDPKITEKEKGYDLNSNEKNKSTYYILEENNDQKINDLTDSGISGHIIISNKFRKGQFEYVREKKEKWFSFIEGKNKKVEIPIIFMNLDAFISLYEIVDDRYEDLKSNTELKKEFNKKLVEEMTKDKGKGYVEFDDRSVKNINDRLISVKKKDKKDGVLKEVY